MNGRDILLRRVPSPAGRANTVHAKDGKQVESTWLADATRAEMSLVVAFVSTDSGLEIDDVRSEKLRSR